MVCEDKDQGAEILAVSPCSPWLTLTKEGLYNFGCEGIRAKERVTIVEPHYLAYQNKMQVAKELMHLTDMCKSMQLIH